MGNYFHTCAVSHAPITKRAMVLPMGETPYSTPTEHGPWWMFSLPFFASDNYAWQLSPPKEPGNRENNTPEEVAEAVCAATSMKFLSDYIEKTNPETFDLELIKQDDVFEDIKPFRYFRGNLHDDFQALADGSYHVFNDRAREVFAHLVFKIKEAIENSGAPTADLVHDVFVKADPSSTYRVGNIRPGVVAISKGINGTKGMLHQTLIDQYQAVHNEVQKIFAANPVSAGWTVVRPAYDYRYQDLTKDPAAKTPFKNVQTVTLIVSLSEPALDVLAAKIEKTKRNIILACEADYLIDNRRVNRSDTSVIRFGFAYVSEAAWKAVLSLPVPKEQRDWNRHAVSQDDFVAFAHELADYIGKALANGTNKSLQLNVPPSMKLADKHNQFLERMQEELNYLLGTSLYVREGETPQQRLESALEDSVRLVFDLDKSPPFYEGLLNLLLRTIIDGDNFLKDIAAKSSLSVRECQEIIYRRVFDTKTVIDRLEYLRIKPAPALTTQSSSYCDTNYHARALRTIATAIRAEGAKASSKN